MFIFTLFSFICNYTYFSWLHQRKKKKMQILILSPLWIGFVKITERFSMALRLKKFHSGELWVLLILLAGVKLGKYMPTYYWVNLILNDGIYKCHGDCRFELQWHLYILWYYIFVKSYGSYGISSQAKVSLNPIFMLSFKKIY